MSLTVNLPWPPKELSPNARLNWRAKHRRRHAYRHTCSWACVEQKLRRIDADHVLATITFCPPDNRRRDLDNMLAGTKAGIDAVAEAIGVDDSKWHIEMCRGLPTKGGNVRITVEPADTWEHISEPLARVVAAIPYPKKDVA